MIKMKVIVDRQVRERSAYCGVSPDSNEVGFNCAVALAINDLIPNSWVSQSEITVYRNHADYIKSQTDLQGVHTSYFVNVVRMRYVVGEILLPQEVSDFIDEFDELGPDERVNMEDLEFEIEIPDSVIELVGGVEEAQAIINRSKTLELV